MTTVFSVKDWVGEAVALYDGHRTIYAHLIGVSEGCALLSDARYYSIGRRDEATYHHHRVNIGKVAIPLGTVERISKAVGEPTDGDDMGLPNPFYKPPVSDPPPHFARRRRWLGRFWL